MKLSKRKTDIPVLLLYDLDPAWETGDIAAVREGVERLEAELRSEGHPVIPVPVINEALEETLQPYQPDDYILFNWCESLPGTPHSEALVARILESLDFTFTGASSDVLAFCWDKASSKELLIRKKISSPAGTVLEPDQAHLWKKYPAIVKPSREHCSLGITSESVVMDQCELKKRINFIRAHYKQAALVEEFIDGREFHVTVLGNGEIKAFPAVEMDFKAFDNIKDRLCTYDSKFLPGSLHYEKIELRIPAELDEAEHAFLKQIAIRAYNALGCRDYGRVDLRMSNETCYVLDINPNPDFSPDTSFILGAEALGHSYGAIASYLVNLAARRHPIFSRELHAEG